MKLIIDKKIFEKFPSLSVGVVIARNIDNKGEDKEIFHLLEEVEELIKDDFTPEDIAKHKLIAPWKAAYLAFGAKPKKHHNSVESLMRTILEGGKIRRINKLVDLYNYLSLKHLVPMGADDLDEVIGNIRLTFAKGSETFIAIGKAGRNNPEPGEVIYRDELEVLCRRWNWRECYKTRITEDTKNAILYVEGLKPVTEEELKKILEELADLVKSFLGGETNFFILNKNNNELGIK